MDNSIKNFVDKVNKLHAYYNDCNKKFAADQVGFLTKAIDYANQGKNHSDLAKDLDFPEALVAHIVSTVKEDMNSSDDFNYKKEYGSKFCDKFIADTKNFIKKPAVKEICLDVLKGTRPTIFSINKDDLKDGLDETTIEIGLEDLDNLWWADNMWVNAPFEIPKEIMETYIPQVHSEGWSFSLRLENFGNKHYLEASSDEEKAEVLEMLRLMNKHLK